MDEVAAPELFQMGLVIAPAFLLGRRRDSHFLRKQTLHGIVDFPTISRLQ